MMRSWWLTFALLATVMSMTLVPKTWAQATDKPGEAPKKGRFSIEFGITSKGLILKFGGGVATPEPAPAIDAMCPNIVPAYVQSLMSRVKGAFTEAPGMSGAPKEVERDKQVTQLFEVGEIYRRTGHYASARVYYQRAHLAAPTSRLGRLAIERLGEIEDRLREAEESSEIDPQSLFFEMRERTIPLGLAQSPTY
jgi:hypothetical protein